MKKTIFTEENQKNFQSFFNDEIPLADSLALKDKSALQQNLSPEADAFLDKCLSVIKWIFFYLPGAALIHLAMMGLALMFFYGEFEPFSLLGFLAVGTFLIMLSFGKLRELKYLKTVLTILAFSFVTAVFYDFLAFFIKGDFFGLYARLTLPLILLIGFLSKRSLDKDEEK